MGVFQPGTGEIEVIEDDKGRQSIPSVVSFTFTGVFSGHEGQELSDTNPQNTIYDAKRFIGKIFDEDTLEKESTRYPFKVHISYFTVFNCSCTAYCVSNIFFTILGDIQQRECRIFSLHKQHLHSYSWIYWIPSPAENEKDGWEANRSIYR